jgi:IclR family transcriptional regulator, pca regulon regulatory protein
MSVAMQNTNEGSSGQKTGDEYIQSLARGLAVIRTFNASAPRQTLTEVAKRAGLDRAGARRVLLTLKTLGYVRQEGRSFLPMPSILSLGYSYLSTIPWWSRAERKLIELTETVNESASYGVLNGSHVVVVVCVHARKNPNSVSLVVGRRSPAHCTAIGRILLGNCLPNQELCEMLQRRPPRQLTQFTTTSIPSLVEVIRRDQGRGWSVVNREFREAVCSIAVPVYSPKNQLMGAISVSGASQTMGSEKMVDTVLPHLQQTAAYLWN